MLHYRFLLATNRPGPQQTPPHHHLAERHLPRWKTNVMVQVAFVFGASCPGPRESRSPDHLTRGYLPGTLRFDFARGRSSASWPRPQEILRLPAQVYNPDHFWGKSASKEQGQCAKQAKQAMNPPHQSAPSRPRKAANASCMFAFTLTKGAGEHPKIKPKLPLQFTSGRFPGTCRSSPLDGAARLFVPNEQKAKQHMSLNESTCF